MSRRPAAKHST